MKRFRFKILGAMICVFVIAIVIITALSAKAKSGILQQPGQKQNQTPDFLNQPPVATQQVKLFYATTQGQGESSETTLSSAAADGSNIVELLKLKGQIKEITPLKNGDVIFLSELSLLDRGRKIVKVHNDSESAVFTAGEGYLIDSYLLSPDEQTLLLWEVDDAPQPAVSRFLLLPVGGGEAQTILTQTPDEQTKYPLFWSQATNRIYFDSYSINRGGLHHGIFSIKADGTDFRPEHWFEEEYSNTPILSANGVWAAVASFNPAATIQLAGTSPT
ncbi:hypothetical protein HYS11_00690, partial [Candidatus Gottesmanbacteria bacterium]|nr:hypothetical protein [Candidatus Gottesmanbacteria bacterium]